MGRVTDLQTDVLSEGEFDATNAQALRWLTLRHRRMVVRARCFRKTVTTAGPTVANQRDYTLPADLIEVLEVTVDGVTYGNGRHVDISSQAQSLLWITGTGGVTSPEESATGAAEIALIPTPTTSGGVIAIRGVFAPPDLDTADDTTLKIPSDFDEALVAGAIATAMRRGPGDFRADIAQSFEQQFADGCEELRVQVARKYRGPGPAQIRVAGFNA